MTTMTTALKRIRPVPLNNPHTLNFGSKKKECKRIDEMNKKMLIKLQNIKASPDLDLK